MLIKEKIEEGSVDRTNPLYDTQAKYLCNVGSIFSFGKVGTQGAGKNDEAPVHLNGSAAPADGNKETKEPPTFSFGVKPLTELGPSSAAGINSASAFGSKAGPASGTVTPAEESSKDAAGKEKSSTAQTALSDQTNKKAPFAFGSEPSQSTAVASQNAFSFGSAAAQISGTAAAQTGLPFTFASGAAPSTNSAASPQSSSGFSFGAANAGASSSLPAASTSAPDFGSSAAPNPTAAKPSNPGFSFGSTEAPSTSGNAANSQSIPAFTFGSGAAQQSSAAAAAQSAPGFSFGTAPANTGQGKDPEQGSDQAGMPARGGSESGFVFGSQPASSGSSLAPAVASGSSSQNPFGGGNAASMPAGVIYLPLPQIFHVLP